MYEFGEVSKLSCVKKCHMGKPQKLYFDKHFADRHGFQYLNDKKGTDNIAMQI